MALSPIKRSGATRRLAGRETGNVSAVPDLLRHEVAIIRRVGHRLQVDIGGTAARELVFPAFPGKDRPEPSVTIGSVSGPPCAVAIALPVVIVIVPVEVDVAIAHRDLHRGVAVRCGGGRRKRRRNIGVVRGDYAELDEIEKAEVRDVMGEEIALVKVERLRAVRILRRIDALIVIMTAPVSFCRVGPAGEARTPRIRPSPPSWRRSQSRCSGERCPQPRRARQ